MIKNVLQVSHAYRRGGASQSAWSLHQSYLDAGINSCLAIGQNDWGGGSLPAEVRIIPNLENSNLWKRGLVSASKVLEPIKGLFPGSGRIANSYARILGAFADPSSFFDHQRGIEPRNFPGTWKLYDLFDVKPDVIHCHNLHGGYFDLRALPYLSSLAPLVLNIRDAWLLSGHCAHSFSCYRWKSGCGACPDLSIPPAVKADNTRLNWAMKRSILKKTLYFVATPSQWMMNRVVEGGLISPICRVIPNGIDVNWFHPGCKAEARSEIGLHEDAVVVMFAANFTVNNIWKDLKMMRDVVNLCARNEAFKKSGRKLVFLCVGEENEKILEESGVEVIYHPFLREQSELATRYRAADVYIHAAKAESFGRTITEAMACGTPVVATATGGIVEQVVDNITGFLVREGDSVEMSNRVLEILGNPSLRASLSNASEQRVRCNYTLEIQRDRFLEFYDEVSEYWKKNQGFRCR